MFTILRRNPHISLIRKKVAFCLIYDIYIHCLYYENFKFTLELLRSYLKFRINVNIHSKLNGIFQINIMCANKIALPPISTLTGELPTIYIDQPDEPKEVQAQPVYRIQPRYFYSAPTKKPTVFTAEEDLEIFKAMKMYLGKDFGKKIPWSFWQVFRKMSGSKRSDSSLYHHWNGSIEKKYGNLIRDGKIDDCIKAAESALEIEKKTTEKNPCNERPLVYSQSLREFNQFDNRYLTPVCNARPIVHFPSFTTPFVNY